MNRQRSRLRPMTHAPLALLVLALLLVLLANSAPSVAARGPRKRGAWVVGRVTGMTERRIYLDLGRRFGLRVDDPVQIQVPGPRRWLTLKLAAVTTRGASALLPDDGPLPPRGAPARARWRATDRPEQRGRSAPLPPVETLAQMTARWRGAQLARPMLVVHSTAPAAGGIGVSDRLRGSLRVEYLGQLNLGTTGPSSYHRVGLWSDLDLPRLLTRWIDYSHRLRVRVHLARDLDARRFQDSRPIPLVYRLRLGLGRGAWRAELGRMRGAPLPEATVVDGATARVGLADWLHFGAFGGLLPRSEDLRPSAAAGHFGGYASLRLGAGRGGRSDWSASADLGLVGSSWEGELDRRALSTSVFFDGFGLTLDGRAVVDLYDGDHPSGLSGPSLSTLGAALRLRPATWLELGARFDRYRWVPTLEHLAAFPSIAADDPLTSVRGFVDGRLGKLDIGFQLGWERQSSESWTTWGELMVRMAALLTDGDRLRLAGSFNRGSFLFGLGGRLAYLLPLVDWIEGRLSYGLHRDTYREAEISLWRHNISAGLEATIGAHWVAGAEMVLQSSEEEKLLLLLATVSYHF